MLTLTEAWKKSYLEYLDETENSINEALLDLAESTEEINKGFEYIQEYFNIIPLDEVVTGLPPHTLTLDDVPGNFTNTSKELQNKVEDRAKATEAKKDKQNFSTEDITSFLMKQLGQKIINSENEKDDSKPEYKVEGIKTVETLSDMKFPKNIIFFIQQIIAWIKRVVVYFIEKIKNVIRAVTGRGSMNELNPDALKLKLTKAKEFETILTPDIRGKNNQPMQLRAVKASDVDRYYALKESFLGDAYKEVVKSTKDDNLGTKKTPVVISIDISKDLLNLKELIQHFYDLYDNAFGSNNEDLFKTDDLELVLGLFKEVIAGLKSGDIPVYQVGSTAAEVSAIDASRVRDNLIRTNNNVSSLKEAYVQTADMIKDVSRIITHKEMLMLSGYGIDNKWLSSATYAQMYEILTTLKPRLKEAEKNEKELNKMQKKYEAISNELVKMQRAFNAFSNVSYNSVYQRRIVDMCQAAKYMTQVVTLRLTAIGMYIKEMKDIKDLIVALSNINKK